MKRFAPFLLILLAGCTPGAPESGRTADGVPPQWTDAHTAAWDLMASAEVLTLITLDAAGQPQARLLETVPQDSGRFDVWMGTNRFSAKVPQIRADSRAAVFYQAPAEGGYVSLQGRAYIVEDAEAKALRWQPHWSAFYPEPESTFVLIHFIPESGSVVSHAAGTSNDPVTWAAPVLTF